MSMVITLFAYGQDGLIKTIKILNCNSSEKNSTIPSFNCASVFPFRPFRQTVHIRDGCVTWSGWMHMYRSRSCFSSMRNYNLNTHSIVKRITQFMLCALKNIELPLSFSNYENVLASCKERSPRAATTQSFRQMAHRPELVPAWNWSAYYPIHFPRISLQNILATVDPTHV